MEEQLRSGWGSLLKPIAWRGALCHGPSAGNKVTFTRPATWIADWPSMPQPEEAAPVAISAYLGAYGPATPEAFDAWLSRNATKKSTLRGWFAGMADDLTTVDVEGQDTYLLAEHADDLGRTKPSKSVRLLGAFDQYVLGPGTKDPQILAAEHRANVSRAAGWISPIVVVAGRVTGTWELVDDAVTLSLFPGTAPPPKKDLQAAVAHLRAATGRDDLTLRA